MNLFPFMIAYSTKQKINDTVLKWIFTNSMNLYNVFCHHSFLWITQKISQEKAVNIKNIILRKMIYWIGDFISKSLFWNIFPYNFWWNSRLFFKFTFYLIHHVMRMFFYLVSPKDESDLSDASSYFGIVMWGISICSI